VSAEGDVAALLADVEPRPRVVLVDSRSERRAVMRRVVEQALGAGTVVAQAGSEAEALAAAGSQSADAVVVEIQMPRASGLATSAALRAAHPGLRILVCTFHGDSSTRAQAAAAGADVYLLKPVNARDLRRALQSDVARPAARASLAFR
jgi:DNA-binding NarL/FixJ family response regulator